MFPEFPVIFPLNQWFINWWIGVKTHGLRVSSGQCWRCHVPYPFIRALEDDSGELSIDEMIAFIESWMDLPGGFKAYTWNFS